MFCYSCGHQLDQAPPTRCATCGIQHWNDAKPCAGALVVDRSRLLLIRRAQSPWKGRWDIPGGFCDAGEHPIQTARREVFEETGLQIDVIGILGMWLDAYEGTTRTLTVYYHATLRGSAETVLNTSEVAEVAWFRPSELPDELAFTGHVPAALDAWRQAVAAADIASALLDRPR
jgi:ADP-ribose pyrophosphatase YjhB (NUDIX family)